MIAELKELKKEIEDMKEDYEQMKTTNIFPNEKARKAAMFCQKQVICALEWCLYGVDIK